MRRIFAMTRGRYCLVGAIVLIFFLSLVVCWYSGDFSLSGFIGGMLFSIGIVGLCTCLAALWHILGEV